MPSTTRAPRTLRPGNARWDDAEQKGTKMGQQTQARRKRPARPVLSTDMGQGESPPRWGLPSSVFRLAAAAAAVPLANTSDPPTSHAPRPILLPTCGEAPQGQHGSWGREARVPTTVGFVVAWGGRRQGCPSRTTSCVSLDVADGPERVPGSKPKTLTSQGQRQGTKRSHLTVWTSENKAVIIVDVSACHLPRLHMNRQSANKHRFPKTTALLCIRKHH